MSAVTLEVVSGLSWFPSQKKREMSKFPQMFDRLFSGYWWILLNTKYASAHFRGLRLESKWPFMFFRLCESVHASSPILCAIIGGRVAKLLTAACGRSILSDWILLHNCTVTPGAQVVSAWRQEASLCVMNYWRDGVDYFFRLCFHEPCDLTNVTENLNHDVCETVAAVRDFCRFDRSPRTPVKKCQ